MNEIAIYHLPESAYAYPLDHHRFFIRLRVAKDDPIESVQMIYGDKFTYQKEQKTISLTRKHEDQHFSYYEGEVSLSIPRLAYVFLIKSEGKLWYYSEDGLTESYDFINAFYNHFQIPAINETDLIKPVSWAKTAVFYQIFVERFAQGLPVEHKTYVNAHWNSKPGPKSFFGGDLVGIIDRLPYLAELGVNAIYLTPINPSASNHKYNVDDYYAVDAMFGDSAIFHSLVKEAHKLGIRIVLDAVFNHCSHNHPWFKDVVEKGNKSAFYDYFYVDGDFPLPGIKPLNYQTFAFTGYMPKLNTNNPAVQNELIRIGEYWIKQFDIDGWRLDVADEVAHTFWRKFRLAIKALKPEALIIGENWHRAHSWLGGDQFDGIMNYGFTKAALDYFAWEKMSAQAFVNKLNLMLVQYPQPINNMMLNLLDSHDTHRFFTQCKNDLKKLQIALAFTIFFIGMPCIYYGTEVPLEGSFDPDSRRGMNWSVLEDKSTHWRFVQMLIKLRTSERVFLGDEYRLTYQTGLVILERIFEREHLCLIIADSDSIIMFKLKEVVFASDFDGKALKKGDFIIARI